MVLGVKPCTLGFLKNTPTTYYFFYNNTGTGAEIKITQLLIIIISVYFFLSLYPSSVIVKLLSQSSQEAGAT